MSFLMFGTEVHSWQIFVAGAFILGVLEVFIPGFIMLPIGIAMLLTAPLTLIFQEAYSQLLSFAVILGGTFFVFSKYVRPKFNKNSLRSNVSSMIGKTAIVEKSINNDQDTGEVKLYGDHWRALSEDSSVLNVGERAKIVAIDGNKVIVKKIN